MKKIMMFTSMTVIVLFTFFLAPCASGATIESVTVYERTGYVQPFTFMTNDPRLEKDPDFSPTSFDWTFFPGGTEVYDLYISNSDGTPNMQGMYLTIDCIFPVPGTDACNIDAVSVDYSNGNHQWATVVTAYTLGGGQTYAGANPNAALGPPDDTPTYMGNVFSSITVGFGLTLPIASDISTYCVSTAQELQNALTEAQNNGHDDIIRIVQGTYNGNFVYASTEAYSVTVEGGYTTDCLSRVVNPENTVLDASNSGVVLALSTPGHEVIFTVDGLTVQGGNSGSRGGGLFVTTLNGTAVVSNSIFYGNTTATIGGGIYITDAGHVTLTNNTMSNNTALANGSGAGLGIFGSGTQSIALLDNEINNNIGTGVWINTPGSVDLLNNEIVGNRCLYPQCADAGGVKIAADEIIFDHNTVCENQTRAGAGGIMFWANNLQIQSFSVELSNNVICNNSAIDIGGGYIGVQGILASVIITNNIITNNSSGNRSGGLSISRSSEPAFQGASITMANNTIVNNYSVAQAGGLSLSLARDDVTVNIHNNIIWNNNSEIGSDLFLANDADGNYMPGIINLYYNDFDQSPSGTYIQIPFPIDPSNLDNVDPLFVDASNGDFHLQSGSPVINQGSNSAPNLPSTDKDGLARILYGIVDMGAYEYLCTGSFSLTATKEGNGSGSLSASGLSCNGNTCTGTYNCGTTITISATADTGSHFESWSGCDSTSSNLCIVTMAGSKSVSSTFTLDTHTLTATKAGTGTGSLTASGLSCNGSTCTGTYDYNETVHITATADTGSVFGSWSGCDSVNGNVCTILINGDKSVTATFYLEYTLLVNLEGTGDGRVVSTPSGIDCEPTCSDTFPVNTPVTLRAYPYGGSAFAYWSGACSGASTTCEITMSGYNEVFAHFVSDETKEYKLTVGKKRINKGDGLVQSDDGTISCGTVCTGLYYPNAPVTLRATPSPGSLFEGWTPTSLNCGASPTCSFIMDTKHSVKAIFRGPYRLLTKIKSKNNGSGSVTSDISGIGTGINCPSSSCEDYYPYGNNVVLTAQSSGGSQFMGWKPASLGCGTSLTCTVPMTKKKTVTATFEGM